MALHRCTALPLHRSPSYLQTPRPLPPLSPSPHPPGPARWDVRMTGWLLWVAGERPDSTVWAPYIALLPPGDQVGGVVGG